MSLANENAHYLHATSVRVCILGLIALQSWLKTTLQELRIGQADLLEK